MAPILKFGIAGLGVAANNQIIPAMLKHPNVKITAAADIRSEVLDSFSKEYNAAAYQDVEQMCKDANVDAVYLCTPNHLHKEHVIIAAEHKKHIIVEKPMALSLEECKEMNEAVEKNGVKFLCGHTKSFDAPIKKMREIVNSGELGKLVMINTWNYTDFLYRPRMPHELNTERGGGAVYIQGPHQVDIVRLIGGGMVRSVRAMTGIGNPARPTEGHYVVYLEFEDGTPATIVYSGYSHFDTSELHYWVGESGQPRNPETNVNARRIIKDSGRDEPSIKEKLRYGGGPDADWVYRTYRGDPNATKQQPFFGLTLVSCEEGDIRQSPDGLYIYGNEGKTDIHVPQEIRGREAEISELYDAILNDRSVFHDGKWGQATIEVCMAIYQSAKERREIFLSHQVPVSE